VGQRPPGRRRGAAPDPPSPGALTGRTTIQPADPTACESAPIADEPHVPLYHRVVGWRARRIRRVAIVAAVGLAAFAVTLPFIGWELATLAGWDVAAAAFLVVSWEVILRSDGERTRTLATREDETRQTAAALVLGARLASLLAVVYALALAGDKHDFERGAYIATALLTVVLSWAVVNTLYTLRYADIHYRHATRGVEFGGGEHGTPDFRDFAYLAFTVGMCYQVSDQTLRSRHLRRAVLVHSLVSYVFGVVIIASTINAVAGLLSPS
jgi:uncharacterized membrane protein